MSAAREEVLARIRTAIPSTRPAVAIPRAYRGAGEAETDDWLSMFVERVGDYRANVSVCAADRVAAELGAVLDDGPAADLVVPAGFPESWLPAGRRARQRATVADLDGVDAVVTTCSLAIATTGTIVLDHGPGQGERALTLVPDRHVVVVRAEQIVAGVPDAVARLGDAPVQTWISGPSATSDIELERVEGVHGPRRLDVLVVRPGSDPVEHPAHGPADELAEVVGGPGAAVAQ